MEGIGGCEGWGIVGRGWSGGRSVLVGCGSEGGFVEYKVDALVYLNGWAN